MRLGILVLLLSGCCASLATAVRADDVQQNGGAYPDALLSPEQWRIRVEEAQKNAKDFVSGARSKTYDEIDFAKERARIADERVMNDESLRDGDIVSTSRGLLIFKGASDRERQQSDFFPITSLPAKE